MGGSTDCVRAGLRNAHEFIPDRWRVFKLSKEPTFVEKLHEIVGLYVAPPAHAAALSFDEKSQVQAPGAFGRVVKGARTARGNAVEGGFEPV